MGAIREIYRLIRRKKCPTTVVIFQKETFEKRIFLLFLTSIRFDLPLLSSPQKVGKVFSIRKKYLNDSSCEAIFFFEPEAFLKGNKN